jgi:hypothetical protein
MAVIQQMAKVAYRWQSLGDYGLSLVPMSNGWDRDAKQRGRGLSHTGSVKKLRPGTGSPYL